MSILLYFILPRRQKLTVKSVVDAVNNIIGGRSFSSKTGFVLLDDLCLAGGKVVNLVKITNTTVRSMGDNLSSNTWVHTGHLEVCADVGVVHVNDV